MTTVYGIYRITMMKKNNLPDTSFLIHIIHIDQSMTGKDQYYFD